MLASFQPPASWTARVAARGGGPAGGELDGESHANAVRGSTALETGRGAGGRKPAVHLVDTETDDRIAGFRRGRRLQAADGGRAAADQAADVGVRQPQPDTLFWRVNRIHRARADSPDPSRSSCGNGPLRRRPL